jgi:hypothetical protein
MSGNRTKHIVGIILTVSFFTLALLHSSYAQQRALQGFVYELESSNPIWNVTVKNLRTQEETTSDREGKFQISTQLNDYLTFTMPGYQTDTAFIYEEGVRRVYMLRDESSIILDEVVITKLTDSRLESEIRRVSPSRLFGKKAKDARANLALLIEEQNNRKVDKIFTARLIASIVPLNDEEIALFRTRFRPSVDFVKTASPEDLRIYILDSYKKFRADE